VNDQLVISGLNAAMRLPGRHRKRTYDKPRWR
jgi:hypothetical protein